MKFLKKNKHFYHIEADHIFLDSKNLPFFDKQKFEGKIEKPISKQSLYILMFCVAFVCAVFIVQLYRLQVVSGKKYLEASINNTLDKELVFAPRGVIYDRNEIKLAWNEHDENQPIYLKRMYTELSGFSHVLGYLKYPKKDSRGYFWRTEYSGMDGIEKQFNNVLSGKNGARIIESNVKKEEVSSNIYESPIAGENVVLSLDSELQKEFYQTIKSVSQLSSYDGASALMMDIDTGEILVLTNYPEYSSDIMSVSKDEETISGYFQNKHHPLLNRAIAGLYAPGSIVKPFVGIGALVEGVITSETKILSHGSISIPNPYHKDQKSVFVDFRPNNGWVNIKEALSVSSNIFFYNVGGGFQGQKGIGIVKIGEYFNLFGLGNKTNIELPGEIEGVIPSIEWKQKTFPNDPTWRIGDTYNTAIGQYGVQVTPLQMLHAVSIIAKKGMKVPMTILKKDTPFDQSSAERVPIDENYFTTIHSGMRLAVTSPIGTAKGLQSMKIHYAAKTGTAQVGPRNEYANTWIMGFFPYEKPKYVFVVMMDKGASITTPGAPTAASYFFQKFEQTEFYKKNVVSK